jgi:hypothetical protein
MAEALGSAQTDIANLFGLVLQRMNLGCVLKVMKI